MTVYFLILPMEINGILITNVTDNYYVPTVAGNYTTLINNNCGMLSYNQIKVEIKDKTIAIYSMIKQDLFIYPNPFFDNRTKICFENYQSEELKIKVYDLLGKTIFETRMNNTCNEYIELPNELNGVFYVVVENRRGERFVQKIKIVD